MKNCKIILPVLLVVTLLASCKKDHYDVSNVHGVVAEGELLLPVSSQSFTVMDLMERFEVADQVSWTEDGDMWFSFKYDSITTISGMELLKFKDVNFHGHYSFDNPFPFTPFHSVDTVVSFGHTITFESDDVHVLRAQMKSGHLHFKVESNVGNVQHVVLRSSNIKDAMGRDFELDVPVHNNAFGFTLEDVMLITDEPNTLDFNFELRLNVQGTTDPELYVDVEATGEDLAFREMFGYVDAYETRNCIDSVFTLFPDNLSGMLEVEGVRISVKERNTFTLGAMLVVDTAMLFNEGQAPVSILDPLPLVVNMPPQPQVTEANNQRVNGAVNVAGGRAFSTSTFIVNPEGFSELVTVVDTSRIDTEVDVEIPFSFTVDDIAYLDTTKMDLSNLELPDLIEELTMDLTFISTLPLNLKASFYAYDSESERITDTLLDEGAVIRASLDGRPTTTDVSLVVDERRLENVMHSDRIIMAYWLDSDGNNVKLNVNQKLDMYLKVRAKYYDNVEFN